MCIQEVRVYCKKVRKNVSITCLLDRSERTYALKTYHLPNGSGTKKETQEAYTRLMLDITNSKTFDNKEALTRDDVHWTSLTLHQQYRDLQVSKPLQHNSHYWTLFS